MSKSLKDVCFRYLRAYLDKLLILKYDLSKSTFSEPFVCGGSSYLDYIFTSCILSKIPFFHPFFNPESYNLAKKLSLQANYPLQLIKTIFIVDCGTHIFYILLKH